jgi:hypothetical protein
MGTQRLGTPPDTAPWRRVVSFIVDEAGVAVIAAATTDAALDAFQKAKADHGVAFSFFLLVQVALAACGDDEFAAHLRDAGLVVPDAPDLFDLSAAFTEAVDRRLLATRGRTDLGEMAQLAAVEALTTQLGSSRAASMFAPAGESGGSVRDAAREISTPPGFGLLAHQFFTRFAQRFLTYHLGRELSCHVGGNGCFADPDEHDAFVEKLGVHCHEAAYVTRRFARDWYAKHRPPRGPGFTLGLVRRFVAHALEKVRDQFARRGARDV